VTPPALMDPGPDADPWGVAQISHTAQIEVRAPADAAFAAIAEDILAAQRPIDDGPLRVGFRWAVSRTGWIVTELREPWVLEHRCLAVPDRMVGGERWQLDETGDGSTIVSLRAWCRREGVRGWLEHLFASPGDAMGVPLRARLASVRLRAEQGAPGPA
jgi:hypothetical protein